VRFAVLLHVLGVVLWMGGGVASMVVAMSSRRESGVVRAGAARLLAVVHARVITPGALLTIITGFNLSMQMGPGAMDSGAMLGMAATGMLSGILVLVIGLPTALKRARAAVPDARGELPPIVAQLSRRQAVVSTIAGLLGLAALVFAYLG
jgi:hypothetical protein